MFLMPVLSGNVGDQLGRATTRLAASVKVRHRLPYVDSFAAALAQIRRARLVTADEDFMLLGKQFPILWLR